MANGREQRIADLRERGLQPFVAGEPVAGPVRDPLLGPAGAAPGQTLAQTLGQRDPLGFDAGAGTYTPLFVRQSIEQSRLQQAAPQQELSAIAARQPTEAARASTLAELSGQRMAQESQERLAAITAGGAQRFSPISTGAGAVIVDRATGEARQIGGAPAPRLEDISAQQEFIADLLQERGQLISDNPSANTAIIDKRIDLATKRLDSLTGQNIAQTAVNEQNVAQPAMSDQDRSALEWARQNPTDPRANQILKKLGVQ